MLKDPALGRAGNEINQLAKLCADENDRWWHDPETALPIQRNVGQLLMLVVSEIAEAMEGDRKDLMDDKLPHRRMFEVELADALIRIFDLAGHLCDNIGLAFAEKMEFNRSREDHTHEARRLAGGKRY